MSRENTKQSRMGLALRFTLPRECTKVRDEEGAKREGGADRGRKSERRWILFDETPWLLPHPFRHLTVALFAHSFPLPLSTISPCSSLPGARVHDHLAPQLAGKRLGGFRTGQALI